MDGVRRPTKALTARAVETAKLPGKYFDGHGLYLRVEKNGSRFWVQRIVIRGKRRELGLGSPDLVPLAEARAKALANRKMARDGGDPIQSKRETLAVMTFEEAARRVCDLHLPTWKDSKHANQFMASLANYAFPVIGKARMTDITSGDVLTVLSPLWNTKAETARRVKQRMATVMT